MNVEAIDILRGMDVIDRVGQKIGSVAALHGGAPDGTSISGGFPSRERFEAEPSSGPGYLKVQQGGILGVGCRTMYIPYAVIVNVIPHRAVEVNCTKEECLDRFSEKPSFLG